MKLYSIRGGNIDDVENKKYTIGVGISLGNKWFTPENISESVRWALQYSKDQVVIYIADSVHAINLVVRNRINHEKALRKVTKAREELFVQVKKLIDDLSEDQKERIHFVTWNELIDNKFKEKLLYMRSLYLNSESFKEYIHTIVKAHTKNEQRKFSDEDIHNLGKYIVEEMPEMLNRVRMNSIVVDAYTYPFDNEITKFVEKIQNGEIYPEIKANILDTEPKVFLEVR